VRVSYAQDDFVPLPEGHPFPMGKFPARLRILSDEGRVTSRDIVEPDETTADLHACVHRAAASAGGAPARAGGRAARAHASAASPKS